MESLATQAATHPVAPLTTPGLASRRNWLKGLSALLGTGVLAAAPTAAFASPDTLVGAPLPASDLVGGDEYIGMVKLLTGTTVPPGWALCNGRVLPTTEHPALFAMLGTTYGGDGRRTFALPDMRVDMANLAAFDARRSADAVPIGRLFVVKVANAPATTTAVAELRMVHLYRSPANQNG